MHLSMEPVQPGFVPQDTVVHSSCKVVAALSNGSAEVRFASRQAVLRPDSPLMQFVNPPVLGRGDACGGEDGGADSHQSQSPCKLHFISPSASL
jgi:hypothetical protein